MQESKILESKHNTMLATDPKKKNETINKQTATKTKTKNQNNDFKGNINYERLQAKNSTKFSQTIHNWKEKIQQREKIAKNRTESRG